MLTSASGARPSAADDRRIHFPVSAHKQRPWEARRRSLPLVTSIIGCQSLAPQYFSCINFIESSGKFSESHSLFNRCSINFTFTEMQLKSITNSGHPTPIPSIARTAPFRHKSLRFTHHLLTIQCMLLLQWPASSIEFAARTRSRRWKTISYKLR